MMTEKEIMREFWRLCDLVTAAEKHEWTDEDGETHVGLLDVDEGQRMRDEYRERADAVLDHYRQPVKRMSRAFAKEA